MIESENGSISISRQCQLLGVSRSVIYYKPVEVTPLNLNLMNAIDEQFMEFPFLGSRKMTEMLCRMGHNVNRKRVQRLMNLMGIEAVYPKPNLSKRNLEHKVWPYLLSNYTANFPNDVWGADITYIRMKKGFLYLFAILDLFSRYVLSWRLSNSLEADFCIDGLKEAILKFKPPQIFNTDQGSQFTSDNWIKSLLEKNVKISMDSKGRAFDNIFVERLWRSVKYEEVYLNEYQCGNHAHERIDKYFNFYNEIRPHQSLGNSTPMEIFYGK